MIEGRAKIGETVMLLDLGEEMMDEVGDVETEADADAEAEAEAKARAGVAVAGVEL